MCANPSYSAMLMVSSPYCGPYSSKEGNQPSYFALGTYPLIGNQSLDVDFHPWKSNLMLIIALPEQHYNNPNYTRQLCPHIGHKSMKAVLFGLGWVRPHHLTHISLRTSDKAPTPPSRNLLSLYQELEPSRHFPLAAGARSPQYL